MKALSLNLDDSGQNFAGTATIRAAIMDVIDGGHHLHVTEYEDWHFSDRDDEDETERRSDFVAAVIARIAELQNPPHSGIKMENLCPRHIKMTLPRPTAMVCRMCEAERGNRLRGDCTFKNGICVECGKSEY